MSTYIEQWQRTIRWFERFQEVGQGIDIGRSQSLTGEGYRDNVFAFFQNCYHLKDWIKNDPSRGFSTDGIEDVVNSSKPLSLCADICNGSKHLDRTRSDRSQLNPRIAAQHVAISLEGQRTTFSYSWSINTDEGNVDAFRLACDCIAAWQDYFKSVGVNPAWPGAAVISEGAEIERDESSSQVGSPGKDRPVLGYGESGGIPLTDKKSS